jgi:hypothetical protein
MPHADGLRDGAIAHEHRVHRVAEELLDEQRGGLVCRDEVGDRPEHGAITELLTVAEQPRCRRG